MRRAWWLGVVLVACDFDAAYERRCDAGLCAPSGGGSSGGQSGGGASGGSTAGGQSGGATAGGQSGGATAGGQGGGATAGGQGGGAGALCGATPTLEVTVFDGGVTPISATACVKLDIALRCQGVRLDAGVPIQLQVINRSTAQPRPGTFFSDPDCTVRPSFVETGDVYFNSTVAGQGHMFGHYEISIDAGVAALSRVVQLQPGIAGSPAMVAQPVNTCAAMPPISFVGLTDALPVMAPAEQRFRGLPSFPLMPCGTAVDLVVAAGQSTSTVMPEVSSLVASNAGFGFNLYGDAGQVSYLVRPCVADGGTVGNSSDCCQSNAQVLSDGGFRCQ